LGVFTVFLGFLSFSKLFEGLSGFVFRKKGPFDYAQDKNRLGDARSGVFGVFWRWEMKIFGDFFCVFAFFFSFFRKNDEKLAYVFGVRAYLIDFAIRLCPCGTTTRQAGDFTLGLAVVIPTPTSLCGGPFASQLVVSRRNYYLVSMAWWGLLIYLVVL